MDEVGQDGPRLRGDPSAPSRSARPEQNNTFADHYLEVPYDLSNVMFVATANISDPSAAASRPHGNPRDPGYTRREKLAIAKQHLCRKQLEEARLTTDSSTSRIRRSKRSSISGHARRAFAASSGRSPGHPRRRSQSRRGRHQPAQGGDDGRSARIFGAPKFTSEVAERTEETGVATDSPGRVSAARSFHRSDAHVRHGKMQLTGQLGRRQ